MRTKRQGGFFIRTITAASLVIVGALKDQLKPDGAASAFANAKP
ncbi:MAG TPA: hypothetical protein VGB73_17795 [Pyrinomonadaceae bacterium]|jgi:hypothetical protein